MTQPRPAAAERVLVIIPTFDERENLPPILDRVRSAVPDADVLVVDDASPDGTGELADQRAAADPHIQVLHRSAKNGLGAAYVAAFRWGQDRGYTVLVEMDADGSHPPEQLPDLLAALADADLVIGSRYVPGGSVVNWPRRREALSRGANLYSRLALGVPVHDVTAGFRAYRAQVLAELPLAQVESRGYCFQVDLTLRTVEAGFRVVEVPITFTERAIGVSKMSSDVMREALVKITSWGVQRRWSQLRAKARLTSR